MKLVSIVSIIVLLLVYGAYFYKESKSSSMFLVACTNLTGKALTVENVKSLNGKISLVKRFSNGSVQGYLEEVTSQNLVAGTINNTLYIYRRDTDNNDSCDIKVNPHNNKISATPNMHAWNPIGD